MRPSISSSTSTKAPNSVRLRTLPWIFEPTGYLSVRSCHGLVSTCFRPSEIRRAVGSTPSTIASTVSPTLRILDAMVLGVDPTARRISLGLKQVETNPWHELTEKYPVGTRIKGKVRNLTEFGAFVEVEEDIDGLIHISDMSWSKRIKHPSEVLKKGDDA